MAKQNKINKPMLEENSNGAMLEESTASDTLLEETSNDVLLEESKDNSAILEETSSRANSTLLEESKENATRKSSSKSKAAAKKREIPETRTVEESSQRRNDNETERRRQEEQRREETRSRAEARREREEEDKADRKAEIIILCAASLGFCLGLFFEGFGFGHLRYESWGMAILFIILGLVVASPSFVALMDYSSDKEFTFFTYLSLAIIPALVGIIMPSAPILSTFDADNKIITFSEDAIEQMDFKEGVVINIHSGTYTDGTPYVHLKEDKEKLSGCELKKKDDDYYIELSDEQTSLLKENLKSSKVSFERVGVGSVTTDDKKEDVFSLQDPQFE